MRKRDHKAALTPRDFGENDDESLSQIIEKGIRADAVLDEELERRQRLRLLRSAGHRPVKYQLH